MRVLCSAVALEGHVGPLLPIATALTRAGHDVLFATGRDLHARIYQAGLTPIEAGPSGADAFAQSDRDPRLAHLTDSDRGGATFSQVIAPAKLPDQERIHTTWHPDLVVHEATDLAAPIAAAENAVPAVTQGWGLIPLLGITTPSPSDVVDLWRSRGLEPAPFSGMYGALHLHPAPPALQPEARVPVGRLQPIRLDDLVLPTEPLPDWADELGRTGRSVVYVGLGTHTYFSKPEFFRTILTGLASLGVEVVATVSENNDPASLGSWPETFHLERWLPLASILSKCSVAVCHAGAGTMLACLATGLPLVMLPRGADQFENTAACVRAGAARTVPPDDLSPRTVREEVEHVLSHPDYPAAAGRLRAELHTMPSPAAVVPVLEDLVRAWRP